MNIINIVVCLLIGVISLILYKQKFSRKTDTEKSIKIATLLTIITGVITILGFKLSEQSINFISIGIGLLLNFFITNSVLAEKFTLKTYFKFIGGLVLFFASSLFQLIPITIFNLDINNLTPAVTTYLTFFSDLCVAVILIIMHFDSLKTGIKKAKENFNAFFDESFKYWIIGFVGMMISNVLISLLLPEAIAGNENAVQSMINVSPWIMLICAGVFAPIIEELIFRQSFREVIKNKWIYIISSGLVFGLLHVVFAATTWLDFVYAIPYSILGLSFAYMVEKTDNVCSSILMHFLHNTMIVLLSIFTGMIIL